MRLILTVALAGWLAVVISRQQQPQVEMAPKKVAERLPQDASAGGARYRRLAVHIKRGLPTLTLRFVRREQLD